MLILHFFYNIVKRSGIGGGGVPAIVLIHIAFRLSITDHEMNAKWDFSFERSNTAAKYMFLKLLNR